MNIITVSTLNCVIMKIVKTNNSPSAVATFRGKNEMKRYLRKSCKCESITAEDIIRDFLRLNSNDKPITT